MGFVIHGFLSALTSTMDVLHLHPQHVLTRILVLLSAFELTQCFPVTASKGGDRTIFFCKAQGCAVNVTYVLCKDENLPLPTPIQFCKGPPPPNTVCQYDGRAFVSIDSDGICEFEGAKSYFDTIKCTDQRVECDLLYATTTPPVPEKDTANYGLTVGLPIGGFVMVLSAFGVIWYVCKRRQKRQQQKASDSAVTVPLRRMQSPEETSKRDANGGGPGLDDSSFPPQPDHEAQTPAAS